MLVYREDFIFEKAKCLSSGIYVDKEYIHKMYVNILLFNEVNRVKNIQHDEHRFMALKLDFPQIGMNSFSPVGNIYNYHRRFRRPLRSLFKYMCHLKKGYKFKENKSPYFIKDYEFNSLQNEHVFKFYNNCSYFTSISRSSGKAIYRHNKGIKPICQVIR